MEFLAKLIVFLPLVTAIYVGLSTRTISPKLAQVFTIGGVLLSALFSWILFFNVAGGVTYKIELFDWINSGDFQAMWSLRIDTLTAIMLTLITTVSCLVHIYSVGYMSHDPHPQRFMSYLSLFTFFMIVLVTSDNLLQLFVGWEGVGLCSYLLIGFWFKKPSANAAAMKAFIVNRVGDFALILGLFFCYFTFGSIYFDDIFAAISANEIGSLNIGGADYGIITITCVLLFIGCMGKSAQIGLHTWLPDAMEGPTPVSALIHAATMVTAGVFLVARMSPLFELSEFALAMVTIVGAVTALFAATIAITQNDIKKVIAYSTCSQLGYMFFACGVSAYGAGVFHLFTHGFFKALLFLSAGSVIHAMSNEQDMRNMGGIWRKIPFTYAMMIIGTLAITGFPLLSGFYSKDMVLEAAFASGQYGNIYGEAAYWFGITAALLTAFYSWRLIFMTFHGKCRASEEVQKHIHESPKVMTLPLLILSLGALFIGALYAKSYGIVDAESAVNFWNGAIAEGIYNSKSIYDLAHEVPSWVIASPMIVGAVGFILAFIFYILSPALPAKIASQFSFFYKLSHNKWYFDELYNCIFVEPSKKLGKFFSHYIDKLTIDNLGPNGLSFISLKFSTAFKKAQSGYVYHYSFIMLLGIIIMIGYLFI